MGFGPWPPENGPFSIFSNWMVLIYQNLLVWYLDHGLFLNNSLKDTNLSYRELLRRVKLGLIVNRNSILCNLLKVLTFTKYSFYFIFARFQKLSPTFELPWKFVDLIWNDPLWKWWCFCLDFLVCLWIFIRN